MYAEKIANTAASVATWKPDVAALVQEVSPAHQSDASCRCYPGRAEPKAWNAETDTVC
jgi:hypothetical protein